MTRGSGRLQRGGLGSYVLGGSVRSVLHNARAPAVVVGCRFRPFMAIRFFPGRGTDGSAGDCTRRVPTLCREVTRGPAPGSTNPDHRSHASRGPSLAERTSAAGLWPSPQPIWHFRPHRTGARRSVTARRRGLGRMELPPTAEHFHDLHMQKRNRPILSPTLPHSEIGHALRLASP
jgi:hypothetical protein